MSVLPCSDPNNGDSKVPALWPPFTKHHHPYLTINNKIDKNSIRYQTAAH